MLDVRQMVVSKDQCWWNGWIEPPTWSLMGFILDSRYVRMHNI